jgi:hypothetical protein
LYVRSNKYRQGLNSISNRLRSVSNMIEKSWLSLAHETFKMKCKINIIQAGLLLLWITCSMCGVLKEANHVRVALIILLLFNHSHFVVWGKWDCIPQTYYAHCWPSNNYFTHVNQIVSRNKTQIKSMAQQNTFVQKAANKMMERRTPTVNFINVIRARFSNERCFGSFYYVTYM